MRVALGYVDDGVSVHCMSALDAIVVQTPADPASPRGSPTTDIHTVSAADKATGAATLGR